MPEMFSFSKSKFSLSKGKDGTSRVALWKILKIPAVYTLETSLCGAALTSSMPHFTPSNLMAIGKLYLHAILIHQNLQPPESSLCSYNVEKIA
jgi:hypothetical protein